jgi:hypothetical protein
MAMTSPSYALLSGYSAPQLKGSYQPATANPHVFTTRQKLVEVLRAEDPLTTAALRRLVSLTRAHLRDGAKFTLPYDGCAVAEYLHRLTYHGATEIASDLALYAYLTNLHMGFGDLKLAEEAKGMARTILVAWAQKGFRQNGVFMSDFHSYCDPAGSKDPAVWMELPLQFGRGMSHWVQAQDLLIGMNALSKGDLATLDTFLDNMFELIRTASNYRAEHMKPDCSRFSNQVTAQIDAMLAIARLKNDAENFMGAAFGHKDLVLIPWTLQLQQNIYGNNERPIGCYNPAKTDPKLYAEQPTAQPGEVLDRYRAKDDQPFGYSLGSLMGLVSAATILEQSGYSAYSYAGDHGETLDMSLDYYSYYFIHFASRQRVVVPDTPDSYPGYRQYVGHSVTEDNGASVEGKDVLLLPYLVGASIFPRDEKILAVLRAAAAAARPEQPLYAADSMLIGYLPAIAKILHEK